MSGVKDRVALVTGAGSPDGIGFATARLLYSAGAKIAITSTTDRINERRNELSISMIIIFISITSKICSNYYVIFVKFCIFFSQKFSFCISI